MELFSTQKIILIFVFLAQISISSGHYYYGKPCRTNYECISSTGNKDICLNGQCNCHSSYIWDPIALECLIPVDYFCVRDLGGGRSCVKNSECLYNNKTGHKLMGICTCKEGFFRMHGGLCEIFNPISASIFLLTRPTTNKPKLNANNSSDDDYTERRRLISSASEIVGHYKKPCLLDVQCFNEEMMLVCRNNVCSCYRYDIYDENLKKCVATPGKACFLPENPCVVNATCHTTRTYLKMGTCICDPGFEISPDENKCIQIENLNQNQTQKNPVINTDPETFGFYGKTCSSNEDCENPNILLCQGNKCSCPTNSSFWDQNDKICRSTIGHFCSDDNPCVENAICYNSICLCDNGYHKNHQGNCISIENFLIEQNSEKISSSYLGYVGWILAAILFILFFTLIAFLGFKKWKKFHPSWPIYYKTHKNEGSCDIQMELIQ